MSGLGVCRSGGTTGLYLRCVLWGLATGAVVGSVTGALIAALSEPRFLLFALVFGAVIGTIMAVLPSVLGAGVVVVVLASHHPHPASEDDVRRDLATVFCAVVGTLDVLLLGAIFLWGDGFSSLARSLPYVAAGTVSAAVVLRPAQLSIARAWLYT